jgi:hypothetical protein
MCCKSGSRLQIMAVLMACLFMQLYVRPKAWLQDMLTHSLYLRRLRMSGSWSSQLAAVLDSLSIHQRHKILSLRIESYLISLRLIRRYNGRDYLMSSLLRRMGLGLPLYPRHEREDSISHPISFLGHHQPQKVLRNTAVSSVSSSLTTITSTHSQSSRSSSSTTLRARVTRRSSGIKLSLIVQFPCILSSDYASEMRYCTDTSTSLDNKG